MQTFEYSCPAAPPPSPFLVSRAGGGWVYERPQTRVRAELGGGTLRTPLPRARFHAEELAGALGLGAAFAPAFAAASRAVAAPAAPRLPVEAGLAWWRYVLARPALRVAWPAVDIVVPDLLLFARREGGVVTPVLVWPDEVRALLIPGAAGHVVLRPDPLRARPPGPPALLPRAAVLAVLEARSIAVTEPVPYHLYRGGEAHAARVAALRALPGEPARSFRAVQPDEVVDG